MDWTVRSGFWTAWFFAGLPTSRSPSSVNATTDGVVRSPSSFVINSGSPPSITANAEFVVPRSIPRILLLAMFSGTYRTEPVKSY